MSLLCCTWSVQRAELWEGTQQAPPTTDNYRRGRRQDQSACTRKESSRERSLLQEALPQRQSFVLDYCSDLEEIYKASQYSNKNTHDSWIHSFAYPRVPLKLILRKAGQFKRGASEDECRKGWRSYFAHSSF